MKFMAVWLGNTKQKLTPDEREREKGTSNSIWNWNSHKTQVELFLMCLHVIWVCAMCVCKCHCFMRLQRRLNRRISSVRAQEYALRKLCGKWENSSAFDTTKYEIRRNTSKRWSVGCELTGGWKSKKKKRKNRIIHRERNALVFCAKF